MVCLPCHLDLVCFVLTLGPIVNTLYLSTTKLVKTNNTEKSRCFFYESSKYLVNLGFYAKLLRSSRLSENNVICWGVILRTNSQPLPNMALSSFSFPSSPRSAPSPPHYPPNFPSSLSCLISVHNLNIIGTCGPQTLCWPGIRWDPVRDQHQRVREQPLPKQGHLY